MLSRNLLFLFTFSYLTTDAQTSTYHPFPESGVTWNYFTGSGMMFCPPGFGSIQSTYTITIGGDTVIASQVYHKLMIPHVQSIANPATCDPYIIAGYQGAFRHDSLQKKVYFIAPADTVEDLLYDFNLQVGDTVKGVLQTSWNPDTVVSIDSVQVGNSYRKRWLINPCYYIYIIEGIGSTYGFYYPSYGCITDGAGFELTCVTLNGNKIYPDTLGACPVLTNVEEVQSDAIVRFFPNPARTEAILELPVDFRTSAIISLYTIEGKLLLRENITSSTQYKLLRKDLPAAAYLLSVENESGQVIHGRVVFE